MPNERVVKERAMPVCPVCGNDGTEDDILYLAWLDGNHSIRVVKGGVVEVEKARTPLDPRTGTAYPSFVCQRGAGYGAGPVCGHRWPVNAPFVFAEISRGVAKNCPPTSRANVSSTAATSASAPAAGPG